MNKSQQNAVEYVRRFLNDRCRYLDGRIHSSITKFEVEALTFSSTKISIFATTDTGEPGTMLHALSHECWLFVVGERGAIEIKIAPKSMKQFAGKRAFRMNVAHDLTC